MTRPEYEEVECRDCGRPFNLAAQSYYDNRCPECVAADAPERTWPGCMRCGERIPPDERATVTIGPQAPGQTAESVPVHKRCKRTGRRGRRL